MSRSAEREKRQKKVFTKWVNSYLRKKKIEVDDLSTCFQSGVNLCYLYEIIADEKLPKYIENPKNMIQKTNNLAIVLNKINSFVEECGIKLKYSAQQIASGDDMQVLGMLWILITKFVIPESEESLSRKRSLLRWVQRVTEPYENVDVKNFTRSWKDGLAFNALLDQFDNSLMDYSSLTNEDPAHNCENAFAIAEKLGIYRLLDVEDITEMDPPDEKSVMTYVSTMYQFFHSQAGRKLEQEAKQLVVDIGRMLEWVRESTQKHQIPEEWVSVELELEKQLEECRAIEHTLHDFNAEKSKMANIKTMMYLKLAKIQRIQRNERIKVYSPPEDKNFGVLQTEWDGMNATVIAYSEALRNKILEIEEAIRKRDEEWIATKENNNKAKRENEMKALSEELKRREDDEKARKEQERKARDEWIQLTEQLANEKRGMEKKRIDDEISRRDEEEAERERQERIVRDNWIAQKEENAVNAREKQKKMLEDEISKREKEEEIRRNQERKERDEWIAKTIEDENNRQSLERKRLEIIIDEREKDDQFRREEERKRRERIIAEQEAKLSKKREEERAKQEESVSEKREEERKKRESKRKKMDEDEEKMREENNKKRVEERAKKEEEIMQQVEKEAERLKKLRLAQDEHIEKYQAEQVKKAQELQLAKEKEISEMAKKKAEEEALKRSKMDEELEKREEEESKKREEVREKKEEEISKKLEEERKAREEERQRILDEKREKEAGEREKLKEYDSLASEFMKWLNNTQTELTHTETLAEDEEDEETDEETRNKRKEAAEAVEEKIKPLLEKWEVLEKEGMSEWASIPINECSYAKDTMLFALIGEEKQSLGEISKFKFPEKKEE